MDINGLQVLYCQRLDDYKIKKQWFGWHYDTTHFTNQYFDIKTFAKAQ